MKYLFLALFIAGCGSNVVQFKEDDNTSVGMNNPSSCTEEQNKALLACSKESLDPVYQCHVEQANCLINCAGTCYNNSLNVVDCVCVDYRSCYSACEVSCNKGC